MRVLTPFLPLTFAFESLFFFVKSLFCTDFRGKNHLFFRDISCKKKAAGFIPSNLNFLLDYKAISPYGDCNANGAGSSLRCSVAPTDALDSVHATFAVIADAVNATNSVN